MRLVRNVGSDRVLDLIRPMLQPGHRIDVATPALSLFSFGEILREAANLGASRFILPDASHDLAFLGGAGDRGSRNRLQSRWLARRLSEWVRTSVEIRQAKGPIPQGTLIVRDTDSRPVIAVVGSVSFSSEGFGLVPGNPLSLIQVSESSVEAEVLSQWFDAQWASLPGDGGAKPWLLEALDRLARYASPATAYASILYNLFAGLGDSLDEEKVINSATGIRNTVVWKKLFKFQRDGVVGAIDKLDRFGGCIIADSVGLGKTFEALAIIKYYELRNDRVLVLVPKRLRDNWTLYKANDRRNFLAPDRFNYDVLNHTDLSRDGGLSGDIDLAHVNWGNYDLVVIDESHNFRNKLTPQNGRETRYDRLMRKIIKEGVKTRVLMLSATPVNNRLADLRTRSPLSTEATTRRLLNTASPASTQRPATRKSSSIAGSPWTTRNGRPARLIDMLGFDYFKLLDLLTIARSRKHLEKYYGTAETGRFPDRLKPINHQGRCGQQAGAVPLHPGDQSTRSAACISLPMRLCATSCHTSRRPTIAKYEHRDSRRRGLLPPGGPGGEPRPPPAGKHR